ncbi:MAG: hypothetical protein JW963_14025 [Anaerolineales bacterium]|nr:hypothetical protein [Anaerolineales bacterium]
MSSPSVTFKLIAAVWVLGCLVACTSPREKSQTLAKELLEQLSAPEGAELIYVEEVENLALQGMGTGFGIDVLYSSSEEYSDIVSRYQELLIQQGWVNIVFNDYSYYCYPGYRSVEFWMWQYDEDDFADSGAMNVISTAETTYPTLYAVAIMQYPFDGDSDCGQ